MLPDTYAQFLKKFNPKFEKYIHSLSEKNHHIALDTRALTSFLAPLKNFTKEGKRIRPYLIAVGADSLDENTIEAGVAFELFHTFILIHDDIMDDATMRRNTKTVHKLFEKSTSHGKPAAIFLGDFLAATSMEHLHTHAPQLLPELTKMYRFLCIGQYYELLNWNKKVSHETSKKIQLFKSAHYTFMYPLRVGLLLAGKNKKILDKYANAAGLAFQMRDDWLDVSEERSGKDKELDKKNEVPNTIQQILSKNKGDTAETKKEVEKYLAKYKKEAVEALQQKEITQSQRESLTKLTDFITTI